MKIQTYSHGVRFEIHLKDITATAFGENDLINLNGKFYYSNSLKTVIHKCQGKKLSFMFDIKVIKESMFICVGCKERLPKKLEIAVRLKNLPI